MEINLVLFAIVKEKPSYALLLSVYYSVDELMRDATFGRRLLRRRHLC